MRADDVIATVTEMNQASGLVISLDFTLARYIEHTNLCVAEKGANETGGIELQTTRGIHYFKLIQSWLYWWIACLFHKKYENRG